MHAYPMKTIRQSNPLAVRGLLAACHLFLAGQASAQSWLPGSYPNIQTTNTTNLPIHISYQGASPVDNDINWDGFPANAIASQQINFFLGTELAIAANTGSAWTGEREMLPNGGTHYGEGTIRSVWVWSNRRNEYAQANSTCNLIAPSAPVAGVFSTTLRRTAPLPWNSSITNYQKLEVVLYSGKWWKCLLTGTTQTPGPSASNWVDVTGDPEILAPSCRFEYKTWASAIASNITQAKWLAGEPAYEWTGSSGVAPRGFMDVADSYALDVYSFTNDPTNIPFLRKQVENMAIPANADAIFQLRCIAVDKAKGANTNFVVKGGLQTTDPDGVYLQINRLADIADDYVMAPWVNASNPGGGNWAYGQIVRDDRSILPNNFSHLPELGYDETNYTVNPGGFTPPAFGGTFQYSYNNGHQEGYVELNSATQPVIRHRYAVPADSSNYLVTVTGWFTTDISAAGTSNILAHALGLDSAGNYLGSAIVSLPSASQSFQQVRDEFRQFKLRRVFNATGTAVSVVDPTGQTITIPATAFPANPNLAKLRFGVRVDNGTVQITSIQVQKITPSGTLPAPEYWQCIDGPNGYLVAAPTGGANFTAFAEERALRPAKWQPQTLALQLDHEASDERPINDSQDSGTPKDSNLIYQFKTIHTVLQNAGYKFFVYTNDIDRKNGVALNNSFYRAIDLVNYEDNLTEVLANVDKFIPVTDEANFRSNSIPALMGSIYNLLRYELTPSGAFTSTPRASFAPDKISFGLPLSGRYVNSRAPVMSVGTKKFGTGSTAKWYYMLTLDTNVTTHGSIAGGYIYLDGFAPGCVPDFNGNVYRVKQGLLKPDGTTDLTIDAKVDHSIPSQIFSNGLLVGHGETLMEFTTDPAAGITYTGGGLAGGGGSTKDDFKYASDTFIKTADPSRQITHWDMWRLYAHQPGYVSEENPSYLNNSTQEINYIRLAGDGKTLILLATAASPTVDSSGFHTKTLFTGEKVHAVTLDGFTGNLAPLNGCTFEPIFSGSDPDHLGYTGRRYALRGFNGGNAGNGFGLTPGVSVWLNPKAKVTDAYSLDVNRKIGIITFGATP